MAYLSGELFEKLKSISLLKPLTADLLGHFLVERLERGFSGISDRKK